MATLNTPYDGRIASGEKPHYAKLEQIFTDIGTDMVALNIIEEGTWTPTYQPASGAFDAISYTSTGGQYIKIGNFVICTFAIRTSAITIGTATGECRIGGLPFTVGTTVGNSGSGYFGYTDNWGSNPPSGGLGEASTTQIRLFYRGGSVTSDTDDATLVTDMNTGANANQLFGSITYKIA